MMSDPDTVDGITVDEVTGRLVLLIEEDRPWADPNTMHRELSAKVRHYVRHIKSAEFAEEHGRTPKDTCVRLVYAENPGQDSLDFFERVGYELKKHDIAFEHEPAQFEELVAAPPPAEATAEPHPTPEAAAETEAATFEEPAEAFEPDDSIEPEEAVELDEPIAFEEALGYEPTLELEELSQEPPSDTPEDSQIGAEAPEALAAESTDLLDMIEADDEADALEDERVEVQELSRIEDLDELAPEAPELASAATPMDDRTPPPFFPEEEFGRSLPEIEPVEPVAVSEPATGQEISLDVPESFDDAEEAPSLEPGTESSLPRAIGAAATAAIASAIVWGALAFAANQFASPLTLVVALMVGISIRVRGAGHTAPFRVTGIVATLIGSFAGSVLAAAAVSARADVAGIFGAFRNLAAFASTPAALLQFYSWPDLAWLALAIYASFRISASRAPSS